MASVSTSRVTLGALFGTVTTAANTVSTTLAGIDKSAGMFNAAVENAAINQQIRHKLDRGTFERTYAMQKALELDSIEQEILNTVGNDPSRQASFNARLSELQELLK